MKPIRGPVCFASSSWMNVTQWRSVGTFLILTHTPGHQPTNLFSTSHGKSHILVLRIREMMDNTSGDRSCVVRKSTEDCVICMDSIQQKKTLRCLHSFCSGCIDSFFKLKPACPICNTYHGVYTGTQPAGTMTVTRTRQHLPGFEHCGAITIEYKFPPGIQGVRCCFCFYRGHMSMLHLIRDQLVSSCCTFQQLVSRFVHQGAVLFVFDHNPARTQ